MTIKKSIKRLERRLAHLSERIQQGESEGKDLSHDKAESAALRKAIEIMNEHLAYELDDDELSERSSHRSLGDQVFGEGWEDDLALTEEEREMLSF